MLRNPPPLPHLTSLSLCLSLSLPHQSRAECDIEEFHLPSVFNRCDGRHGRGKESDKEREASERERELKEASDLAETSERERIKWVLPAEGRRDSQAFRDCFPKQCARLTCQLPQTARLLNLNVCQLIILKEPFLN